MRHLKEALSSKPLQWAVSIVGALVLVLLIFHAGMAFGSHRGDSGRRGQDRGFRHPFFPSGFELPHGFAPNNHGAVGIVTSVSLPTVVMQTRDGASQTIIVGTSTMIRGANGASSLSAGDHITVLGGSDEEGQIDAKLIRIISATTTAP